MVKIFWLAPLTVAAAIIWLYFTFNPGMPDLNISINFVSANEYGIK